MSLFVDTSVWYAAVDASDASNTRAKAILTRDEPLVCTDHVLTETWTMLRNRIHRHAAERFWDELRSGTAMIEPVGTADLEAAWQIGLIYRDQDFSLVDRTSFAVMQPWVLTAPLPLMTTSRYSGSVPNVATPLRLSAKASH